AYFRALSFHSTTAAPAGGAPHPLAVVARRGRNRAGDLSIALWSATDSAARGTAERPNDPRHDLQPRQPQVLRARRQYYRDDSLSGSRPGWSSRAIELGYAGVPEGVESGVPLPGL